MKCKHCGKEFFSLFSSVCPFCGTDNSISTFGMPKQEKKPFDPYDWDNSDNCSDREYIDDDDYDDFDG